MHARSHHPERIHDYVSEYSAAHRRKAIEAETTLLKVKTFSIKVLKRLVDWEIYAVVKRGTECRYTIATVQATRALLLSYRP